jgi:hypothetical protein
MIRAFLISRIAMPIRLAVFEKIGRFSQGTPRSLAVAIRARYERRGKSRRVALRPKERIRPARLNIVGNYAVNEDGCQEELGF